MAKHYVIPTVSPQKGPTCWYYATKMVLKFHGVITDNDKPQEWRELHEVRKAATELRKQNRTIDLTNVRNTLRAGKPSANPALEGALDKLEKVDDFSKRFAVLAAFFGSLMKPVKVVNWDADEVERLLTESGPLLAAIYSTDESAYTFENFFSLGATGRDKGVIDDPNRHGHLVYGLMGQGRGGRHRVVISGVSGDTIYYRDPMRPEYDTVEPWDEFKRWLNTPTGEQSLTMFYAIDCTRGQGKCPHI